MLLMKKMMRGWGTIDVQEKRSADKLQEVRVTIKSDEICKENWNGHTYKVRIMAILFSWSVYHIL